MLTPNTTVSLKEFILDQTGIGIAGAVLGESSEPIYNSMRSLLDTLYSNTNEQSGSRGQNGCVVFGKHRLFPAPVAALLNGAFSHTLDFDDTHGGAAVHPGAPVIAAVLAQVQVHAQGDSNTQSLTPQTIADHTQRVLVAVVVGYEVTIRLALALGLESYSRGFHMTGIAGIFGGVAALSVLKSLPVCTIENAFGLAISQASGSMQYLSNGSWGKRLHPGWAAHNAFICLALAESGVLGASEPIEGTYGL
jgi:2-methylcitrate dehydratase PrpD